MTHTPAVVVTALLVVKLIGAWLFIIFGVMLLVTGHPVYSLINVAALMALAFALAPSSW